MCQMVVSDNKLGSCDNGSLERSLILTRLRSLASEFCDVISYERFIQTWNELKILYWANVYISDCFWK